MIRFALSPLEGEEFLASGGALEVTNPQVVARRMAEGLLRSGNAERTIGDILEEARTLPGIPAPTRTLAVEAGPAAVAVAEPVVEEADEELGLDAYIETARCTTCNECTNINKRMFVYNDSKQAYIKDATAGTFKELVQAAEKCPVRIIHPGTPLNPKEKNLEKWVKRAEPFN